jgi:dodecin
MVEKTIALTGMSANSIEDAVALAVARAGVTISGIHSAQITDTSAVVENNQVVRWKVSVRLTFAVKDQLHE